MTDRRRNALILTLVGALFVSALAVILTKPTRLGLDLKGGVELVYQAKPTNQTAVTPDAITRAIDIMRKRVDALGVAEPQIQESSGKQIVVSLPNVTNAAEAAKVVGTTAQLQFYDWEKNVLDKSCKPDPSNFAVTGGPNAGAGLGAGGLTLYDAVTRAATCPVLTNVNAASGSKFYLVDAGAKKVIAGPEDSAQAVRAAEAAKGAPATAQVKEVKRGTTILQAEPPSTNPAGAQGPNSYYVLRDDVALAGTEIKNPEQNYDNNPGGGGPNVTFDFTSKGRSAWQKTTREIAQRGQSFVITSDGQTITDVDTRSQHFAIALDNQLISAPKIDFQQNPDGIDGGSGSEISGGFTVKSAQALANQLKYGALPIKLAPISQSQVSATLGQQALNQGLVAMVVGFVVVALFLLTFYRVLGVLAVGALLIYGVYFFALIKLIPVTLTLPGIAGLVLTIGVCADANIVIFERVKEEVVAGRSITSAIGLGYRKGLSTIIDANVVILLTAFILFILSTAGVRGFALTLGLGTLVTLFSAVLATQALLGVTGANALKNPRLVGARTHGTKRRFDFNGATKILFTVSGVILLAGALAISTKGIKFGIDFESGTRIQAAFTQPVSETQVRDLLAKQGLGSADVQRVTGSKLGPNVIQISTSQLAPDRVNTVKASLDKAFTASGAPSVQSVGPTFGQSVARSAGIAVVVSLLLIAVYIALRFEWKYAVTTAISLMHDLLIVAGLYAFTGREVTSATVAALLTVLGFSLYDTIIVNDRLRENMPRMPRATFAQISNRSMNEVVVRSLSTVTCASLPILALLLFGGQTLQDFAFALLVGTVSGAYSSIFISSPVLTQWKEREPVFRRRREALLAAHGEVPPFADTKLDVNTERKSSAPRGRLTAPEQPGQPVPKSEFDQMVRELHGGAAPTQVAERPPEPEPRPAPPVRDTAADALPEDLVMKDKPRRPRNKKHGRPR